MRKLLLTILAAVLLPAPALAEISTWQLDPAHSHAGFTIRHLAITNVRGQFGKVTGTLKLDEQDVTKSSVEATIDAATIDTREPKRDAHLKSADFFDVEKHPKITFRSTKVEQAGEGRLKVTGDLTIRGNTKPVVLEVDGPTKAVKDPQGSERRAVEARGEINRREFGLEWNKMVEAAPVAGDQVKLELAAEFVRAPADPKALGRAEEKAVSSGGQKK